MQQILSTFSTICMNEQFYIYTKSFHHFPHKQTLQNMAFNKYTTSFTKFIYSEMKMFLFHKWLCYASSGMMIEMYELFTFSQSTLQNVHPTLQPGNPDCSTTDSHSRHTQTELPSGGNPGILEHHQHFPLLLHLHL